MRKGTFIASAAGVLVAAAVAVTVARSAMMRRKLGHDLSEHQAKFRVRLRVRLGKALSTANTDLRLHLLGREVIITAQDRKQPLSEETWIVLWAHNFASEEEAREYGEQLRSILEVAAFSCRLGTDAGYDRPTAQVSEDFARQMGWLKENQRLAPNVHGLMILPDDDRTRIPSISGKGTVRADPAQLIGALEQLSRQGAIHVIAAAKGLRLLNAALMVQQPLAQLVLAFSAVEALGQEEAWTPKQEETIENVVAELERAAEADPEKMEIAASIARGLHKVSLRQGVIRALDRLALRDYRKEWDRLYGLRSGLFHGTAHLEEYEIQELAMDTISLCGKIILALLEQDGVTTPVIAETHYRGLNAASAG